MGGQNILLVLFIHSLLFEYLYVFHFLVGLLATTKDILEFHVSSEAGTTSEFCVMMLNTLQIAALLLKSMVSC